jgi:hypothetical protein
MLKKSIIAAAIAGALVIPVAARAHEGHTHKVMGTVSSIDGKNVTVKTTDGKTVTLVLGAKTKITRGKKTVEATSLNVGDRLVAEGAEEKAVFTAATVRLGELPAPPAKK